LKQDVSFYTEGGMKLAARLQLPDPRGGNGHATTQRMPAVLLMPALLAGDTVLAALADRLAAAGYASLSLDFRGTGASEGEGGWLDPFMRLEDARNALAWMKSCESLDGGRLGVWGHRFSAPVAIALAADDPQIRAVVASSGPGNGCDFMRSLRNGAEWLATLDRVRADRLQRSRTGRSELVPLDEIIPMQAFIASYGKHPEAAGHAATATAPPRFWLANIDAIMRFHTEDAARRLGERPLLMVNGERDEVISVEDVRKVYAAASGPKKLVVVPGLDHAGMEVGVGMEKQLSLALEWFDEYLHC
jgi:pimeloyl-ACP methyl ester carboxylesterase